MKISVVIPLLNEHENLPLLMHALSDVLNVQNAAWEVVFIDDGSTDGSFEVLTAIYADYKAHEKGSVSVIRFARNYGKSAALSVGIAQATGDVIITMDADLQDDPQAIPDLLKKISEGYGVVSGWKKVRHDPLSKTLPSKVFNGFTTLLSGLKLHDFNCGFKAYTQAAAKSLEIYGERHRYLPVLAFWNGFTVTEVVVPHHPRKFGKSKFGLGRATGMFDIVTLVFLRKYLRKPLHFFGLIGILFALLGTSVLGYFGVEWIITGSMHLRPLVLLSIGAIIMGIQFVSIGLVGEMIINTSPKQNYQIRQTLAMA